MSRNFLNAAVFVGLSIGVSGCQMFSANPYANNAAATCASASINATWNAGLGILSPSLGDGTIAQSFSVPLASSISQVGLLLNISSVPSSGALEISIESDSGLAPNGAPSGTALVSEKFNMVGANSGMIPQSFSVGQQTYTFTFPSIGLSANARYWIVVNGTYTGASITWIGSANNPYPGGMAQYQQQDGSWSYSNIGPNIDLAFALGCH